MPANILEFIAGGFKLAYYTQLDTDGFATGASGTVTNGAASSSPAGRIKAARTAPIQIQPSNTTPVTGDNVVYGTFQYAPDTVPTFTFELAVRNLTLDARAQGTLVETVGNTSVGIVQPQNFTPIDLAMWFIRDAKSQQGVSIGKGMYETALLPKVQAYPLGSNFAQRDATAFQYQVTLNPFSATPMGYTLSIGTHNTEVASYLEWTSDYPFFLEPFKGDGVTTAFGPLAFTPSTTSTSDQFVYVEGIRRTSGVTISTTTKLVTITPAPLSGQRIQVWYQHI